MVGIEDFTVLVRNVDSVEAETAEVMGMDVVRGSVGVFSVLGGEAIIVGFVEDDVIKLNVVSVFG